MKKIFKFILLLTSFSLFSCGNKAIENRALTQNEWETLFNFYSNINFTLNITSENNGSTINTEYIMNGDNIKAVVLASVSGIKMNIETYIAKESNNYYLITQLDNKQWLKTSTTKELYYDGRNPYSVYADKYESFTYDSGNKVYKQIKEITIVNQLDINSNTIITDGVLKLNDDRSRILSYEYNARRSDSDTKVYNVQILNYDEVPEIVLPQNISNASTL